MELEVTGVEQLARLAKACRAAGTPGKGLRRELLRGIREATKPAPRAVKASAMARLPRRGGLAARVARGSVKTSVKTSGKHVGVTVRATSEMDIKRMDKGRLRAPLFGNRDHWHEQRVPPGWFTEPMQRTAPAVRAGIQAALERTKREVERL